MTTTLPTPLPGLRYRSFQGEADYLEIWKIIMACNETDGLDRSDTPADVARNYAHLHHCDPQRDMLFAEVNGETVGYTRGWWAIDGDGEWLGFHFGYVKPQWRGKGIGRDLLDFIETRLTEIAAGLVKTGELPPEAPRRLATEDLSETEKARRALLEHARYQIIRYSLHMVRPDLENIPDLPLPEGLEVRPALPEHYRTIWNAANEAFRDHWGYIEEPEEEFQNMLESPTFDPSLWRVAWEGDQVAGMVCSFINKTENEEFNRKRGYTENICVRRPWRKRGLAKSLIALSLQALKERGMDHAALGVDAQNISGATKLYESMGYRTVKQFTVYQKAI
jgi:mycothiol synthase